ncbi:MAG: DUF3035 domain-containing protein [Pseudomonadota bacterium]
MRDVHAMVMYWGGKGAAMRWVILAGLAMALGACSAGVSDGPDEFGVVPSLPLEQPESYSELPTPTPGALSRADARPVLDLAQALGGTLPDASGVPASDSALVTHSSRFGVDPAIRPELFQEDEAYRERRNRFGFLRLGRGERYFRIYAPQALDASRELERFRSAGVRVPTAPPAR